MSIQYVINVLTSIRQKRHEINGGMIRALHGYSKYLNIHKTSPKKPPSILFHGTPLKNVDKIKLIGLLPMSRKYVYLADNFEDAKQVAICCSNKIAILNIDENKHLVKVIYFIMILHLFG